MARTSLARRVEILEQDVASLKELPARMAAVESQIVQLREEMHAGFSALATELRAEMRAGDGSIRAEFRAELRAEIGEVRLQMRAMHYEILVRFDQKFDELKRHMHVLHEDTLDRFARLDEGRRSLGDR